MKYIKLFLASSLVEFAYEREALGNYIRTLNDIYVLQGIYFKLFICEDISNEIAKERKQEVYNKKIRESQFFYILLGRDAGDYTIEEFEVALKEFQEKGVPHIYTYFRQLPEGETASQNVLDFMERLDKKIGHYFNMFTHLDSIKLNILLELTRSEEVDGTLQFEDGNATLNGKAVLSLKNVPMYGRNAELQKKKEEKIKLDEEFVRLRLESIKDPQNDEIFNELMKISQQRNELTEQMHQIETNILDLYTTIAELKDSDRPLTWREKEAGKLLDAGDYEGALSILRDEERQKELAHAERIVENGKERIRGYISENRMRISALKSKGITQETIPEIKACYEESVKLAEKYQVEWNIRMEYVEFLRSQQEYMKAINMLERWFEYVELESGDSDEGVFVKHALGVLYYNIQDFEKAEEIYVDTIKTIRKLAKENPSVYEIEVAGGCNHLANLLRDTDRLEESEKLYREALNICRRLTVRNSLICEELAAEISNNLAGLLGTTNRLEESEKLYFEALEIYRGLAARNPSEYEDKVALAFINLARLLEKANRLEESEKLYCEALEIYRSLAARNPSAYEDKVSVSCTNLANLFQRMKRMEEAEALYEEALTIELRLMKTTNLKVYRENVAINYSNLAILSAEMNQIEKSERLYREGLSIFRELAAEEPIVYKKRVAMCCNNLANLLSRMNCMEEVEELNRESLDIYRKLAKENPAAYEAELAMACNNLAMSLEKMKRRKEAEEFYYESLDIYRKLAEENPLVYKEYVAHVCSNLGDVFRKMGYAEESERYHRESLAIRRKLAEYQPLIYDEFVAESCNNFAMLLHSISRRKEAEGLYREALSIYHRMAEKQATIYEERIAAVCSNLAILIKDTGELEQAEMLYREALGIYRRLAKEYPMIYKDELVKCSNGLEKLLLTMGCPDKAEELHWVLAESDKTFAVNNVSTCEMAKEDVLWEYVMDAEDVSLTYEIVMVENNIGSEDCLIDIN